MTESHPKQLKAKMWQTRGCRFNAARRNTLRQEAFTNVNWLTAVHLIGINVLQLGGFLDNSAQHNQILTALSIVLSIIILVHSILESNKDYPQLIQKFRRCGQDISHIYDKLCALLDQQTDNNPINYDEVEKLSNAYHKILKETDVNHQPIDFKFFKIQHTKDFPNESNWSWWVNFRFCWGSRIFSLFILVVPLLITIWIGYLSFV